MKYLFIMLLASCHSSDYRMYVNCEEPYFKGEVRRVFIGSYGTDIITLDGTRVGYPPSVKCQATKWKR